MKGIIKNIFFAIIVTIVFFATLEVACRVKVYCATGNQLCFFYGRSFLETRVKSIADRVGGILRKENAPQGAASGQKIIWTFGGSTTRCLPLKREESWPGKLEYYLRGTFNISVTIINKATNGAVLSYNLDEFKKNILEGEKVPDIAIFYQGINDAAEVVRYPTTPHKKVKVTFFEILDYRLMETSLLYVSLKEKYNKIINKDINRAWKVKNPDVITKNIRRFDKDLKLLVDTAKRFHITLVLCPEPIKASFFEKFPAQHLVFENASRLMEQCANDKDVVFIDVHKEISRVYPDFGRYFIDGVHVDAEGNDLIGRYLANDIVRHGLLDKK